jgi:2-oxoglutarate/2-oxoacid ferredoxin oxidoreductase subunit alpha
VFGDPEGDLLVVGWGSTQGAIEEAVERAARRRAGKVSSLHLRFIQPLPSGIKRDHAALPEGDDVEGNWSDRPTTR